MLWTIFFHPHSLGDDTMDSIYQLAASTDSLGHLPAILSYNSARLDGQKGGVYSMLQPFVDVASNRYILQIFENGDQTSWRFCDRDLFGMVKNMTLLRGESWPPTIGDEKVTNWITWMSKQRSPWSGEDHVLAEKESGVEAFPVLVTLPKTNSKSPWKWMVGILVSVWEGPFSGASC